MFKITIEIEESPSGNNKVSISDTGEGVGRVTQLEVDVAQVFKKDIHVRIKKLVPEATFSIEGPPELTSNLIERRRKEFRKGKP